MANTPRVTYVLNFGQKLMMISNPYPQIFLKRELWKCSLHHAAKLRRKCILYIVIVSYNRIVIISYLIIFLGTHRGLATCVPSIYMFIFVCIVYYFFVLFDVFFFWIILNYIIWQCSFRTCICRCWNKIKLSLSKKGNVGWQ